MSGIYFAYQAVTRVSIGIDEILVPPSISACFRWVDLLESFSSKTFASDNAEEEEVRRLGDQYTLTDIFDQTPSAFGAIGNCLMRKPGSYEVFEPTVEECNHLFNISKFFILEYICYRFDYSASEDDFRYDELSNTVAWPTMIYSISLNESFNKFKSSKFVVHTGISFPFKSISYAPVIYRVLSNDSANFFKKYNINYFTLKQRRLPAPFKTDCIDYAKDRQGVNSKVECQQSCMIEKTLGKFDKLPFSSILRKCCNHLEDHFG